MLIFLFSLSKIFKINIMKSKIIGVSGGFVLGIIVTMVVMFFMMPKMMMLEDVSKYNFEETMTKFEESVKANDWKIVATHDLQKSMTKFGHDVRPVVVYELCHPDHANRILEANHERIVSSLMPCRVAIYEKEDGKIYISRMNSELVAKTMGSLVSEVMADASSQNEVILEVVLD